MKDNKIIAEFMGHKPKSILGHGSVYNDYSKSWDWLMPVVEKIEDTLDDDGYGNNVLIETSSCTILSGNDGSVVIGFTEGITKREATYQAVVEFINNQNK